MRSGKTEKTEKDQIRKMEQELFTTAFVIEEQLYIEKTEFADEQLDICINFVRGMIFLLVTHPLYLVQVEMRSRFPMQPQLGLWSLS